MAATRGALLIGWPTLDEGSGVVGFLSIVEMLVGMAVFAGFRLGNTLDYLELPQPDRADLICSGSQTKNIDSCLYVEYRTVI